jgi:hypothetical protein
MEYPSGWLNFIEYCYTNFHSVKCHSAESHFTDCHSADWHFATCNYDASHSSWHNFSECNSAEYYILIVIILSF